MSLTDDQLIRVQAVQASLAIEGHQVSDERAQELAAEYFASGGEEKLGAMRIDPAMDYEALCAELRRVGLDR